MELFDVDKSRTDFARSENQSEHFLRCWSHQSCHRCLAANACSWCPFTWSCIPNSHNIPFLAPAYEQQICPSKQEQWELRTRPLGCEFSSTTTITGIVSVTGTLAVVLLAFLTILTAIRVRRYTAEKTQWPPAWVHHWRRSPTRDREQEPLLTSQRQDEPSAQDSRE